MPTLDGPHDSLEISQLDGTLDGARNGLEVRLGTYKSLLGAVRARLRNVFVVVVRQSYVEIKLMGL